MILIEDIVKNEIVQKLDNRVKILTASLWSNGQQTITICSRKWLDLFGYFLDSTGGVISILTETATNITIQITEEKAFKKGDFLYLQKPLFFSGTLYSTMEEWTKFSEDQRTKLPFIWLVTPSNETFYESDSSLERNSPIHVVFISNSDWLDEDNAGRLNKSIKPLTALASSFVEVIEKNRRVFPRREEFTLRKFPKFGTETSGGVKNAIFDVGLAGVDLKIELNIYKNSCKC